jgi:3',5'-cyclic AMP phosphodiesterase CpdA
MWIAQLSDPHLRPRGILYQNTVDSNAMLEAAIDQINALVPTPDVVILTGDIVDAGEQAEYAAARELLARLTAPLRVIPGNHDERTAFRAAFCDHVYLPPSGAFNYVDDQSGPVRIIALDVTLPGHHHGDVDDAALRWLDDVLASDPYRPTLIMMHQPPFACDVPYLDKYWCRGGDRLAAVVARYPAVERIVCGHVHRHMQLRFAGTLLCTAPSTTTAIALRPYPDAKPASFIEPPGFLLHHWKPGTGLLTHSIPIGSFPGPFPFA